MHLYFYLKIYFNQHENSGIVFYHHCYFCLPVILKALCCPCIAVVEMNNKHLFSITMVLFGKSNMNGKKKCRTHIHTHICAFLLLAWRYSRKFFCSVSDLVHKQGAEAQKRQGCFIMWLCFFLPSLYLGLYNKTNAATRVYISLCGKKYSILTNIAFSIHAFLSVCACFFDFSGFLCVSSCVLFTAPGVGMFGVSGTGVRQRGQEARDLCHSPETRCWCHVAAASWRDQWPT